LVKEVQDCGDIVYILKLSEVMTKKYRPLSSPVKNE
jgi:hypothetical protein